jgi:copper(I)-binding protein
VFISPPAVRIAPANLGLVWRHLALGCATTALLGLTGCGAGFDAQTQQQYQPAVGVSNREGDVYAINTLVVTDGQGSGTVVSALINQTDADDTLASVTAIDDRGGGMRVQPLPDSGIALPPSQLVQLGNDGSVRVSSKDLHAGQFLTLTFTFANGAPLQVDAPVVNTSATYADVPLGPSD